jgi:hypothetical protein
MTFTLSFEIAVPQLNFSLSLGLYSGSQLINSTFGSISFEAVAQQCLPCGPFNYIVAPNSGGNCQECPKVDINFVIPTPLLLCES